jgi:hypothetical protein
MRLLSGFPEYSSVLHFYGLISYSSCNKLLPCKVVRWQQYVLRDLRVNSYRPTKLLTILFICDLFNDAASSLACSVEKTFLLTQNISNTIVLTTTSKTFPFFYLLSNPSHGSGVRLCSFCVLCYTVQQTPSDGPVFHSRRAKRFRKPYRGRSPIMCPVARDRYWHIPVHFSCRISCRQDVWENVVRTSYYDQVFIMTCATLMFYLVIFYFLFKLQNERLLTSLRQSAFIKTKALFITNTEHNFDRHRSNMQEVALWRHNLHVVHRIREAERTVI